MQEKTKLWLDYTDEMLAVGDEASQEVNILLAVQRGPDYVRLQGGKISPLGTDRMPAKLQTIAVIRGACFPKASAATNKSKTLIEMLQKDFGFTQEEAVAASKIKFAGKINWLSNSSTKTLSKSVLAVLGQRSHIVGKIEKAAKLLGLQIR